MLSIAGGLARVGVDDACRAQLVLETSKRDGVLLSMVGHL